MPRKSDRPQTLPTAALGIVLTALSVAILCGALALGGDRGEPSWLGRGAAVFILAASVATLAGVGVYWSRIDEAAREAHKASWFWGGSAGLGLIGAVAGAFLGADAANGGSALAPAGQQGWFASGVLAAFAAQALGYGVFWVAWWLRRR